MSKLLTIGIPTFNRAELLDKQLDWLAQSIKGFESECEIIISDNCSTDETPNVIKKWQPLFKSTAFIINRNSENIGAVRNTAYCLSTATSKYAWAIGDDDKIFAQTLSYVFSVLQKYSDLALIVLNYSKRHAVTGELLSQGCYKLDSDELSADGKPLFERCAEENFGGVTFTTALVYRTDLVQQAIKVSASGLSNLSIQLYWTAFCAAGGSVLVTKDNYLECTDGTQHFVQNPKSLVTLEYADIAEVFVKLATIGYPKSFSRKMVIKRFGEFNWRIFFGALRRCPLTATKAIIRYFATLWLCTVGFSLQELFSRFQGKTSHVYRRVNNRLNT